MNIITQTVISSDKDQSSSGGGNNNNNKKFYLMVPFSTCKEAGLFNVFMNAITKYDAT